MGGVGLWGEEEFSKNFYSSLSNEAILCYIWGWSHESLHVYSLVVGLIPESSEGSGWLILLFFLWV